MKFVLSIIFLLISKLAFLQSDTSKVNMICDSVFMKDGSVKVVQIKEQKKSKLIYVLCCEECAVPREIKLNTISEIVYAPKVVKHQETVKEKQEVITKVKPSTFYVEDVVTGKIVTEKEVGEYLKITYQDENGQEIIVKGPLEVINKTSIVIDTIDIPLESIVLVHKEKRAINLLIRGLKTIGFGFIVFIFGATQPSPGGYLPNLPILLGGATIAVGGGMIVTSGAVAVAQTAKKAKRKNNPPIYLFKIYLNSTTNQ